VKTPLSLGKNSSTKLGYFTIGSIVITQGEAEAGWNKRFQHADINENNRIYIR